MFLDLKTLLSVFKTKKRLLFNIFKSAFESLKKHFECFLDKHLGGVFSTHKIFKIFLDIP